MSDKVKETANYIIGIDLGGTYIKGALLNTAGHIIHKSQIPTEAHEGYQKVISRILQIISNLTAQGAMKPEELLGIGIGVPGQIAFSQGKVVFAPNLGWQDIYIRDIIAEATGVPVYLDNDGNVAALGEMWCGAGKGYSDIIAVTIGTGIGGGIIIDGRVVRGVSGSAGEIGHMIMLENGPLCNCGQRGCLEALCAAGAMVRQAKEAIEADKPTSLSADKLEVKDIFIAAEKGDHIANEIIDRSAYYLGIAIANTINLLNPEIVIIGGGVANAGDRLINPIRERAMASTLKEASAAVKILPAQLGNDAGSVGAGALVNLYSATSR